ncbi:MAG TPA: carboxypeptidase regulatory-like domain-containing protein [Pyrinomonadaceae bacterium]|nr:carboxypeptidase regulatory-like domain-containing protein [Pyrinomonadaceae bacterium]
MTNFIKQFMLAALLVFFVSTAAFAQQNGSIGGSVQDANGAIVVGASITVVSADAKEKTTTTNSRGEFSVTGLAPGKYTVKAIATNFSLYENTEVEVTAGERTELIVPLAVAGVEEKVDINSDTGVSTDADANKSAQVLKDKDLEALPDDPDELEAALQALAGPAAGPNGGQIYIDGFTGGRMPPKEAIREIRINQNPFSAEYERVGFGRIEILTKPGFEKWRGNVGFNFNDESLNSRNPYSLNRAPSQFKNFSGSFGGPLMAKKLSFFVDGNYALRDENSVISGKRLDDSLNIVDFNEDIQVPNRRLSFSPRVDFAINDKHTLSTRYSFSRNSSENQGVNGISLPTRAYDSTNTQHEFRVTESAILNPTTVNETRFSFERNERDQVGDNSIPIINVSGAFSGGGASIGNSFNKSNRWELANTTTTMLFGSHGIKFGGRVRGINIDDRSESNYAGTFTFSGIAEVRTPAGCVPQNPPCTVTPAVTSIEQFRQNLLGNPDPRYNPNQFSITTGDPLANVSQVDYGLFVTDDWKVNPQLTLSFGLRYENQSNISDNLNFAPRLGFAWAVDGGKGKQAKTVIRGGFGYFYDRFGENNTLRANRQNGVTQLQYTVSNSLNATLLDQPVFTNIGVTNVPTAEQLGAVVPQASIPFRIAPDLESPYSVQTALSFERQLPWKINFNAIYSYSRSYHGLRFRNINAPVCPQGFTCPSDPAAINALRPDPTEGNIYQIESSGFARTQFLSTGIGFNPNPNIRLNVGYTLSHGEGDTENASSPRFSSTSINFPAYSYDFTGEFAQLASLPRHSLFVMGSVGLPWGIRMNPIVFISSGRRFNITTGVDSNKDLQFTERPTFAALIARCQDPLRPVSADFCDVSDVSDLNTIIPRNYGLGPKNVTFNMNFTKTFGFGGAKAAAAAVGTGSGDGGRAGAGGGGQRGARAGSPVGGPGGGGRGAGGGGGFGGFFGGNETRKPYNLTLGLNVQNIFNIVNQGTPIGSMTSPDFGKVRASNTGFGFFGGGGSANRRIDLIARFSW